MVSCSLVWCCVVYLVCWFVGLLVCWWWATRHGACMCSRCKGSGEGGGLYVSNVLVLAAL